MSETKEAAEARRHREEEAKELLLNLIIFPLSFSLRLCGKALTLS
jgi:hypothetical protein